MHSFNVSIFVHTTHSACTLAAHKYNFALTEQFGVEFAWFLEYLSIISITSLGIEIPTTQKYLYIAKCITYYKCVACARPYVYIIRIPIEAFVKSDKERALGTDTLKKSTHICRRMHLSKIFGRLLLLTCAKKTEIKIETHTLNTNWLMLTRLNILVNFPSDPFNVSLELIFSIWLFSSALLHQSESEWQKRRAVPIYFSNTYITLLCLSPLPQIILVATFHSQRTQ